MRHAGSSEADRMYIKTGAAHPTLSAGHDGFVTLIGQLQLGDNSGNAANYVTIDGELAGEINMRVTGSTATGIDSRYSNTTYITLRYLEIDDHGDADNEHGVKVGAGGVGWLIEHCYFHDCYLDCINSGGAPNAFGSNTARYNTFILQDDGIQCGSGWDVYGNVFDGSVKLSGPPLNAHSDAIQGVEGYWRIYGNIFKNCGQCIFIEAANETDNIQHIHIWNNLIYSEDAAFYDAGVAILFRAKLPDNGTDHVWDDIKIWNNTISNLDGVGIRFFHSLVNGGEVTVPAGGILIENNIIYRTTVSIGVDSGFTTSWTSGAWLLRNNIFYQSGGGFSVQFQGTTYTDITALNAHADASGNLNADPLLVDYTDDLRLSAGSPAIGAGLDLSASFTDDHAGTTRTNPWDIGALKYGSAVDDTTPPTPNPSTIASATVNSSTQITVVATTATDAVSSPVEYNHAIDGTFLGWQSSATRIFSGLTPATTYSFRVKSRDAAGNETTQSDAMDRTTDAATSAASPLGNRGSRTFAVGIL